MQGGSPVWGGLQSVRELFSRHEWYLDICQSTTEPVANEVSWTIVGCNNGGPKDSAKITPDY